MGLFACNCPQCGAGLEFDESRDMMFCQYCGSKILKTNVIQNITNNITNNIKADNLNVSSQLDVDTMFYNWLVSQNHKLQQDLNYYYADDDRAKFANIVIAPNVVQYSCTYSVDDEGYANYKKALQIAYKLSDNPKYKPYLDVYIKALRGALEYHDECQKRAEESRIRNEEYFARKKEKEKVTGFAYGGLLIVVIIIVIYILLKILNA